MSVPMQLSPAQSSEASINSEPDAESLREGPSQSIEDHRKRKRLRNALPVTSRKKAGAKRLTEAFDRSRAMGIVRKRPDDAQRKLGVDALTRAWVDAGLLEVEPMLQDSMWVEYRYLSAWERNERFYRFYQLQRRAYYDKKLPLSHRDERLAWCSPDEINAITRARIEADRAGVPYDLYCKVVMDGHMGKDKWEQPPRPNQLYGKLSIPRLRGKLTQEEIAKRLFAADWDARFFATNYAGDPIQESALQLLREDVHAAPNKAARLRRYFYEHKAITRARADEMFGSHMTKDALGAGNTPVGNTTSHRYRPGCYGHHMEELTSPCRSCLLAESCENYGKIVAEEVRGMTGSDDPRADHVRLLNALRAQRHYAKKAKKAGRDVKPRKQPRTSAPSVKVEPGRLLRHVPKKVPKLPMPYLTESDRAIDELFVGLTAGSSNASL